MSRAALLFCICFVSFVGTSCGEEALDKVNVAKQKYDEEVEELRVEVVRFLDSAEEKAKKKGNASLLKMIAQDREDFQSNNQMPVSAPDKLIKQNSDAVKKMRKAYETAKKACKNKKLEDEAEKIESEIEEFEDSKIADPDHSKFMTVGSVWSGKDQKGIVMTYEVTQKQDESVTLERDSVDGKGKIVVEMRIKGRKLEVTRVGYNGPGVRKDENWRGGGAVNGGAISLNYSVVTDNRPWSESTNLSLNP